MYRGPKGSARRCAELRRFAAEISQTVEPTGKGRVLARVRGRVYDQAGNVLEMREHAGEFKEF